MSPSPRPSRKLLTSLLMLSLVPVIAGVVRLSEMMSGGAATPESARFISTPAPVVLHIVPAQPRGHAAGDRWPSSRASLHSLCRMALLLLRSLV